MASASTPSANDPANYLILVHTVQLKTMIKAHFSGRMVSSGINDVAFPLVHSEKTCLKKLMMRIMINIMKIARNDGFSGHQKLTSAMKLSDGRLQI